MAGAERAAARSVTDMVVGCSDWLGFVFINDEKVILSNEISHFLTMNLLEELLANSRMLFHSKKARLRLAKQRMILLDKNGRKLISLQNDLRLIVEAGDTLHSSHKCRLQDAALSSLLLQAQLLRLLLLDYNLVKEHFGRGVLRVIALGYLQGYNCACCFLPNTQGQPRPTESL